MNKDISYIALVALLLAYNVGIAQNTCTDGVKNGDEEGIDCGGTDCYPCSESSVYYMTDSNGDANDSATINARFNIDGYDVVVLCASFNDDGVFDDVFEVGILGSSGVNIYNNKTLILGAGVELLTTDNTRSVTINESSSLKGINKNFIRNSNSSYGSEIIWIANSQATIKNIFVQGSDDTLQISNSTGVHIYNNNLEQSSIFIDNLVTGTLQNGIVCDNVGYSNFNNLNGNRVARRAKNDYNYGLGQHISFEDISNFNNIMNIGFHSSANGTSVYLNNSSNNSINNIGNEPGGDDGGAVLLHMDNTNEYNSFSGSINHCVADVNQVPFYWNESNNNTFIAGSPYVKIGGHLDVSTTNKCENMAGTIFLNPDPNFDCDIDAGVGISNLDVKLWRVRMVGSQYVLANDSPDLETTTNSNGHYVFGPELNASPEFENCELMSNAVYKVEVITSKTWVNTDCNDFIYDPSTDSYWSLPYNPFNNGSGNNSVDGVFEN